MEIDSERLTTHCNYEFEMNNVVTIRMHGIFDGLPAVEPSETAVEAVMKVRRLFKRVCRTVT